MTAYLVYLRNKGKRKEGEYICLDMQVWHFNPKKALRPRTDVVEFIQLPPEHEELSLYALERIYGHREQPRSYGYEFTELPK